MRFWYERAVDEQKKEQREYKKKSKKASELPHFSPPLTAQLVGVT
jgi:hypothetical protein